VTTLSRCTDLLHVAFYSPFQEPLDQISASFSHPLTYAAFRSSSYPLIYPTYPFARVLAQRRHNDHVADPAFKHARPSTIIVSVSFTSSKNVANPSPVRSNNYSFVHLFCFSFQKSFSISLSLYQSRFYFFLTSEATILHPRIS